MAIIPVVRCRRIKPAVDFYTKTLDFNLADDDQLNDPAFIFLRRAGDLLVLSSFGDGRVARSVVMVMAEDVDALFDRFLTRGLKPAKPDSRNTLAFTQTKSRGAPLP
jgi:hypothetical protein